MSSSSNLRVDEVPLPLTLDETNAAIELARVQVENLTGRLKFGPPPDHHDPRHWEQGVSSLRSKWRIKLAELELHRARLTSGATTGDELYGEVVAERTRLRSEVSRLMNEITGLRAGKALRESEALSARMERDDYRARAITLEAELQEIRDRAAKAQHATHEMQAWTLEVLTEFKSQGVPFSALAQKFYQNALHTLPQGFRETWQATELPTKFAADGRRDTTTGT